MSARLAAGFSAGLGRGMRMALALRRRMRMRGGGGGLGGIIEALEAAAFDLEAEHALDGAHRTFVLAGREGEGAPVLAARPVRPMRCV